MELWPCLVASSKEEILGTVKKEAGKMRLGDSVSFDVAFPSLALADGTIEKWFVWDLPGILPGTCSTVV